MDTDGKANCKDNMLYDVLQQNISSIKALLLSSAMDIPTQKLIQVTNVSWFIKR